MAALGNAPLNWRPRVATLARAIHEDTDKLMRLLEERATIVGRLHPDRACALREAIKALAVGRGAVLALWQAHGDEYAKDQGLRIGV